MIDYDTFQKALKHLESQYGNCRTLDAGLPELLREAVKESVVRRFEICYDCRWKILKRYLIEELGIPEVPNSPKPILRLAHENALLSSPVDVWLNYADARIDTSHGYSGEKAEVCPALMGGFVGDAIGLYQKISGKTWQ